MQAKDVMTRQVHTVTPATSIFDLAQLLLGAQVSAVPVVDADGKLLGIVSEADLVHRVELGTERERFLTEEWPQVLERIRLLDLSAAELLENASTGEDQ